MDAVFKCWVDLADRDVQDEGWSHATTAIVCF